MDKPQNFFDLNRLADGAFAEKLNEAIKEVAENIQDPNTDPKTTRQITVNLRFKPDKARHMVGVSIAATTKLAPAEAVGTVMLMGKNLRSGQIEISELFDQLSGQLSVDELELDEDPEEIEEPEQEEAPHATSGKPLDLRNLGKKPPEEQPEEDPTAGRVVNINDKAAQA